MLRDGSQQAAHGEYGMWFSTPGDECFSMSSTLGSIDRVYEAMRGMEESVFAEVLHCTRSIERHVRQAPLPDELVVLPVVEAQDVGFLVSASSEKGIRFHFHRSTGSALRIELLAKFARHFEDRREAVQKASPALRLASSYAGEDWWTTMKNVAKEVDATASPVQSVGKVFYEIRDA
jgi:hypothetical protein